MPTEPFGGEYSLLGMRGPYLRNVRLSMPQHINLCLGLQIEILHVLQDQEAICNPHNRGLTGDTL